MSSLLVKLNSLQPAAFLGKNLLQKVFFKDSDHRRNLCFQDSLKNFFYFGYMNLISSTCIFRDIKYLPGGYNTLNQRRFDADIMLIRVENKVQMSFHSLQRIFSMQIRWTKNPRFFDELCRMRRILIASTFFTRRNLDG